MGHDSPLSEQIREAQHPELLPCSSTAPAAGSPLHCTCCGKPIARQVTPNRQVGGYQDRAAYWDPKREVDDMECRGEGYEME